MYFLRIILLNYTYTRTKNFDQQKVKRQIKPINYINYDIFQKKTKSQEVLDKDWIYLIFATISAASSGSSVSYVNDVLPSLYVIENTQGEFPSISTFATSEIFLSLRLTSLDG